jgi:hypothetical protein
MSYDEPNLKEPRRQTFAFRTFECKGDKALQKLIGDYLPIGVRSIKINTSRDYKTHLGEHYYDVIIYFYVDVTDSTIHEWVSNLQEEMAASQEDAA